MTFNFADRVMLALPERWRDLDEDDVLRRWIDGAFPDMNAMRAYIRGFTTGEYTTPATAPAEMLDWIASLTNTQVLDGFIDRRSQFADPYQRKAGTAGSIRRVVWAITGVAPKVTGNYLGNPWLTVVQTYLPATPQTGTPIVSWNDLATVCPTLADLIAEGTINDLALIDSGRVAIVNAANYYEARPAGIRLAHRPQQAQAPYMTAIRVIAPPPVRIAIIPEAYV